MRRTRRAASWCVLVNSSVDEAPRATSPGEAGPGEANVRVVVVNYNGGGYLARCLAALRAQTYADFDVVVVDNGSSDGSLEALAGDLPDDRRIRLLRLGANLGFAAANNRGAAGAAGRWIATLNPDAFPEPAWLARLVAAADAHPGYAMFGSTQLVADSPDLFDGTGDCLAGWGIPWRANFRRPADGRRPSGETFSPCAAAALYDRALFEQVGGFDERFFCYVEDVDLGFRMRLAGGRCLQVGDAVVLHVGSAIAGSGRFAFYHGYRNQVWTLLKNLPWPLLPVVLSGQLAIVAAKFLWALRTGRWRIIGSAVLDALRHSPAVLADRRAVQRQRVAGTLAIARALTWSPRIYLARGADLRPVVAAPAGAGVPLAADGRRHG